LEVLTVTLSLLKYPLSSQNQRVDGYEIPGDEQPKTYNADNYLTNTELDGVIWAAYRQVFNEQQMIAHNRQLALESQLRCSQITVRDFIRGLVLSDSFRRLNYESNNNYRFVEICIQRLLGRQVYHQRETMAWSVVLATKGLASFIDRLLNSEEYLTNFGNNTIPYQRRRILPQRSQGELPFARMSRYDSHYLGKLRQLGQLRPFNPGVVDGSASVYQKVLLTVSVSALLLLVAVLILAVAPQ
jgi:phycobilisome rod-core linker protein